jgi:nucleoside-diphosphate-sugar epimerase
MKINLLITGISGFIGYNTAKFFIENGCNVIGLIRENTDLWRLNDILDCKNLTLVRLEQAETKIHNFQADVLIHTAWGGVSAKDRDDWKIQVNNLSYTTDILIFAQKIGVKKIICLGSQAEYGAFLGRVDEDFECNPTSVYGSIKLAMLGIFKNFAMQNHLEWYWLRLFSVFGQKEGNNWFIPFLIDKLSKNETLNLTFCEQKYDYIYANDLAKCLYDVAHTSENHAGIYNLSSNDSMKLKNIVNRLAAKIESKSKINFGAIPYRANQVMHMEGNSEKFIKIFNPTYTLFEEALNSTIPFYLKNKL